MGDGRKTLAPCGHLGEVVIGTYVECRTCEGVLAPGAMPPQCPACESLDVEEFEDAVDAALWFIQHQQAPSGPIMPPQENDWHCWECGKVWAP